MKAVIYFSSIDWFFSLLAFISWKTIETQDRDLNLWCFLATETHDGVQDMACDTFIKIAQKCRRQFVQMQVGEAMPFIEEILSSINSIICDLQPQQVRRMILLCSSLEYWWRCFAVFYAFILL